MKNKEDGFLISRVFRWSKKGGIAILDQVLFNGVHFLIAILLARWLEPVEYGIFAVAYSIFLLLIAFHMALLVEPMLIFGVGKYQERFQAYLGALIFGNIIVTVFMSLVLFLVGFPIGFFYSKGLQTALFGLSIAVPFISLSWLLRRSFYVRLEPGWAVIGGAVYAILLLVAVIFLKINHLLSPASYFLSMGLCSLLISLLFIYIIRPAVFKLRKPEMLEIQKDHFCYGKWALGTNVLAWGMNNAYFVILPFWINLKGIAALRALMNLCTPIIQASCALAFLLLPILSRHYSQGIQKMNRTIKLFLVFFITTAFVYLIVLLFFGKSIMSLFYGGKYSDFSQLIPLVATIPLGAGITVVLENALRVLQGQDKVFWSYLVSAIIGLVVMILLVGNFKLKSVLLGYNISYLSMVVMLLIFLGIKNNINH
jgi:O-antigen/teichoic acid export membrane protein